MARTTMRKLPKGFSVAFSKNGALLVCASQQVSVFDVESGKRISRFKPSKNPAHCAFSPDDSLLAVKDTVGTIQICNTLSGEIVSSLSPVDRSEGCGPAFTADGSHLLDGSWSGVLSRWSIKDQRAETLATFENGMIVSLSLDAHQSLLLLAVQHRHGNGQSEPTELVLYQWPLLHQTRFDVDAEIQNAILSHDGQTIAAYQRVDGDWSAVFISVNQKAVIATVPIDRPGSLPDVVWSSDDNHVLLTCGTGFMLIDAQTHRATGHFAAKYSSSVAFHPDGDRVALGTWDHTELVAVTSARHR
jgi:WD40 repeat protein